MPPLRVLRIRVDGTDLSTDDLTLAESRRIEEATGVPWHRLQPLQSAVQASAVLVEVKARTVDRKAAQSWADGLTVAQVLEHLVMQDADREDDRPAEYVDGVPVIDPPPEAGEQGTTSSS
ncbi:hypothetical protein [Klenkia brasiliensis]|uniref:Uncharacterized protein n=1 Tax=Klenkia brasiliensis TaxID=333142 RepID=A0A1G7YFN3_9ACTN|nr:hypothetical protein [Klenkia brasiliensis]SDG95125.1 hypothetical protein SAMN05660324_3935 [Klenkia brasiliensis]